MFYEAMVRPCWLGVVAAVSNLPHCWQDQRTDLPPDKIGRIRSGGIPNWLFASMHTANTLGWTGVGGGLFLCWLKPFVSCIICGTNRTSQAISTPITIPINHCLFHIFRIFLNICFTDWKLSVCFHPPTPCVDTCDADFKIRAMEKRKNVCLEIIYGQINL